MSISKKKKQVKPVKVVNYNISAANCNVRTMMQYTHCLRNINNQSTAICQQIICVDIAVEYSGTILFITTQHRYAFYCKYNAQKSSMEDCLPFHSFLACSIFHIEISVPFHFPYHALPAALVVFFAVQFTISHCSSWHRYPNPNSNHKV